MTEPKPKLNREKDKPQALASYKMRLILENLNLTGMKETKLRERYRKTEPSLFVF